MFKVIPINDAAVETIRSLEAANEAENVMHEDYNAALEAIARFNASRSLYLALRGDALDALAENASTSEGAIAEHETDSCPNPIPDPTTPPAPPAPPVVAEAALDFAGARRRAS